MITGPLKRWTGQFVYVAVPGPPYIRFVNPGTRMTLNTGRYLGYFGFLLFIRPSGFVTVPSLAQGLIEETRSVVSKWSF